jgi:gamma-glutamyl-gamma-aminobutyrate hydrolase PuuD
MIAVSQRVDRYPARDENRDAVDQRLLEFVAACGGLPVPVPNTLAYNDDLAPWLNVVRPAAIVLSGGNDIGSCTERDSTERELLSYARMASIPVLGICRGMQMMAVWAGGELKQVAGHVRTRHRLSGEILGTANSYHAINLVECPPDFVILARSEDNEIEAIRHASLGWEGWMWHPEREMEFDRRDLTRMKGLMG